MLIARVVSLLEGSRAVGLALRALRCGRAATALRITAVIGTVVTIAVGLGTLGMSLLFAQNGGGGGEDLITIAGYLLLLGVPGVWLCGLAGGIVCVVASIKVSERLNQLTSAAKEVGKAYRSSRG